MVEESEITCEHNDNARIPTAHVGNYSRTTYLDIPNKNEKYEAHAIPKTGVSSQNAIRLSWYDLSLTYVDSNPCKDEFQQGE